MDIEARGETGLIERSERRSKWLTVPRRGRMSEDGGIFID